MERDQWMKKYIDRRRLDFLPELETKYFANGFPGLLSLHRDQVLCQLTQNGAFEANSKLLDHIMRIDDFASKFVIFCQKQTVNKRLADVVAKGLSEFENGHQMLRPSHPPVRREYPRTGNGPSLEQLQQELQTSYHPKESERNESIRGNHDQEEPPPSTVEDAHNPENGPERDDVNDNSSSKTGLEEHQSSSSNVIGAVGGAELNKSLEEPVGLGTCTQSDPKFHEKQVTAWHASDRRLNYSSDIAKNLNENLKDQKPGAIKSVGGIKLHTSNSDKDISNNLNRQQNNQENDTEIESLHTCTQNRKYEGHTEVQLSGTAAKKNEADCSVDSCSSLESLGSFYLESSDVDGIAQSERGETAVENVREQTIPKLVHEEIPNMPETETKFVLSGAKVSGTQCQEDIEKGTGVSSARLQADKLKHFGETFQDVTRKSEVTAELPTQDDGLGSSTSTCAKHIVKSEDLGVPYVEGITHPETENLPLTDSSEKNQRNLAHEDKVVGMEVGISTSSGSGHNKGCNEAAHQKCTSQIKESLLGSKQSLTRSEGFDVDDNTSSSENITLGNLQWTSFYIEQPLPESQSVQLQISDTTCTTDASSETCSALSSDWNVNSFLDPSESNKEILPVETRNKSSGITPENKEGERADLQNNNSLEETGSTSCSADDSQRRGETNNQDYSVTYTFIRDFLANFFPDINVKI